MCSASALPFAVWFPFKDNSVVQLSPPLIPECSHYLRKQPYACWLSFSLSPWSKALATHCFASLWACLFDMSFKWNHTIHGFLCLPSNINVLSGGVALPIKHSFLWPNNIPFVEMLYFDIHKLLDMGFFFLFVYCKH